MTRPSGAPRSPIHVAMPCAGLSVQLMPRSSFVASPSPVFSWSPMSSPCESSLVSSPLGHHPGVVIPASGTARSSHIDRFAARSAFDHSLSCPPSPWSLPVVLSLATDPAASGAPWADPSVLLHPTSSSKPLSPFAEPYELAGRTKELWAACSPSFASGISASPGSSARPPAPARPIATDL
jgi:hypothetical protein